MIFYGLGMTILNYIVQRKINELLIEKTKQLR